MKITNSESGLEVMEAKGTGKFLKKWLIFTVL